MTDMVNSPSHYQLDGFEAIDIIKAARKQYLDELMEP